MHPLQLLSRTGRGKSLVAGLIFVLAFGLSSSVVFAHAKLLRSQPDANAALKQSPKIIELWFSEELEQSASTIIVTDQAGKHVDKNNVSLAEGGKKLQVDLEELGSGTYTVEWKALSTDGHTMKGKFTFTVTLAAASAATNSAGQQGQGTQPGAQATPSQTQQQAASSESMQESGTSWTQSLVRWLQYMAMMMLFGGFAFHVFVLGPALRRSHSINDMERAAAMSMSAHRIIYFSWLSLILLVIVSLAALVLQASTVFDKSIGEALSPALLNQIITRTGFGTSWRLQVWAIAALVVIVLLFSRYMKHEPTGNYRVWWWSGLAASAVLMLSPAWTGHAVAAAREFPFAIGTDWLHLLAGGFWVGGLFHLALTMPRAVSVLEERGRLHVLHRVIPLFTRLAMASTILIALTGLYNSWMHVDRFGELWSTSYGETLSLKVLLVIPMLVLGGINTFIIHPRASRLIEKEESATTEAEPVKLNRSFYRSVGIEAALGGVVLLVAAILVFLQPAREHPVSQSSHPSPAIARHLAAVQGKE
jgi:copper transport protein